MNCPKCGCQLPDEANFCSKCGAKVSVETPQPIPVKYQSDMERLNLENGSGNFWLCYDHSRELLHTVNVDVENETADGILEFCTDIDDDDEEIILEGHVVESFQENCKRGLIVFKEAVGNRQKPRFELWSYDWHGNLQHIAGDNNDNVKYYAVSDNWIFAVLENKKGQQFIYQISADLKSASVINSK